MTKVPWYYYISWTWTLPWNLGVWLTVLLLRVTVGGELFWIRGLWLALEEGSWFTKGPYRGWGGTTFGSGGILRKHNVGDPEKIDTPTEYHEHVHEEQFEVASLMAFLQFGITALVTGNLWFMIPAWFSGYPSLLIAGWVQALLRGESAYKGSQHEESAYAQEEIWEREQKR